jgi:hypothetical protein
MEAVDGGPWGLGESSEFGLDVVDQLAVGVDDTSGEAVAEQQVAGSLGDVASDVFTGGKGGLDAVEFGA